MIEAISESMAKVVGTQKGPTIVLLGGIHGNERTGIEVVKKFAYQFEHGEIDLVAGTLYLILGNPRAIERNTRGSTDHADLNRCFKRDLLESEPSPLTKGGVGGGSYEEIRAQELARILKTADISIDLHATNKPSVPFLCCTADEKHEAVYQWFECDRVLADPRYVLGGEPVTTDEFVDLCGGVGMCYETGFAKDESRVDLVFENVLNVLRDQHMIDGEPISTQTKRSVYELTEMIQLTEAGFRFADGRATGSFESFQQGDILGYHGDMPLIAQEDGVILFPKIQEHWAVGKPVCYLGKRIS